MGGENYGEWLALMQMANQNTMNAVNIMATQDLNYDNRHWQSVEAAATRQWQSQEAEKSFERQKELYDTRYSPEAQIKSKIAGYEAAGLNPILAADGSVSAVSAPSTNVASGAMPSGAGTSNFSPLQAFNILDALLSIQKQKAEVANINASTERTNAETSKVTKETSWIDTYNTTNIETMKAGIDNVRSNIKLNEQKVNESIQEVQESIKRIGKMDSEISVNGALVDLHGSQVVLNDSKAVVERLNAKSIQALLPYIQARQEAEIALTSAKTEESKSSSSYSLAAAESAMYEANLKMLRVMVEQKLIDSSYYDSVIDQAHWDVRHKKREYKWQPINDICHNVSMVAIGVGSVMNGASSVKSVKNSGPRDYEEFIETDNYGNRSETLRQRRYN